MSQVGQAVPASANSDDIDNCASSESKLLQSLSANFNAQNIRKISIDLSEILGSAYDGIPLPVSYVLENVLTPGECEKLIAVAEEHGFEPALVTIGESGYKIKEPDFRNNYQTIINDQEFVSAIWERISGFVPLVLEDRPATGLSSNIRFLRYEPGQKFGPHRDGTKRTKNKNGDWLGGDVSMITLQFYLNDGFEGGETTFLAWNNDKQVDVVPKTGSVLIFEHSLLHQGSLLKSGRKYSFITDVMYKEVELEYESADGGRSSFWKQNCSVM